MRSLAVVIFASCLAASSAMAIDLAALWDFSKPEVSEQRFREALLTASGDDALILQTQIARSYGLRKNFNEARVRYALELGRTYASAAHTPAQQTAQSKELARSTYQTALDGAGGDTRWLAIDAIHMLAFVDTAPAEQLKWAEQALAVVESSTQPAAKAVGGFHSEQPGVRPASAWPL